MADDLRRLSVEHLRQRAANLGLQVPRKARKAELIAALRAAERPAPDLPAELLPLVMSNATYADVVNYCRSSQAARRLCSPDTQYSEFWRRMYWRDFRRSDALTESIFIHWARRNRDFRDRAEIRAHIERVETLEDVSNLLMRPVGSWYGAYRAALEVALGQFLTVTVVLSTGIPHHHRLFQFLNRNDYRYDVGDKDALDDPWDLAEAEQGYFKLAAEQIRVLDRVGQSYPYFRPRNLGAILNDE